MNALKTSTEKGWHLNRLIVIKPDMYESPAFRDLSGTALRVLMRFLQKRTWEKEDRGRKPRLKDVRYRDNDLIFVGREAEWLGITGSSFRRAINELVEHGFIEVKHQGGAYGPNKDPSRYRLVDTWRLWGTDSFPNPRKLPCHYTGSFDKYNHDRRNPKKYQSEMTAISQPKMTAESITA